MPLNYFRYGSEELDYLVFAISLLYSIADARSIIIPSIALYRLWMKYACENNATARITPTSNFNTGKLFCDSILIDEINAISENSISKKECLLEYTK